MGAGYVGHMSPQVWTLQKVSILNTAKEMTLFTLFPAFRPLEPSSQTAIPTVLAQMFNGP